MPVLGNNKTTELTLPSGAVVSVKDKLVLDDLQAITKGNDNVEQSRHGISVFITGWNFTDESETPLPVSYDNVGLLDIEDFRFLDEKLSDAIKQSHTGVGAEEKKASSVTLTPPTTI